MAFHCQVFLEEVTAAQLKAEVDDGRPRRVTLAWTGLELLYSCTCPRYTTTLACCRHVWATLHEADCVEEALRAVSATQVRLSPRDRQPRGPGLDPARARAGIPEAGAEVLYVLDRQKILARGELVLSFCTRGTGRLGGTRELTAERDHDHDPWILGRNERDAVLPLLVETRRLHYRDRRNAELRPLAGDKGTAWEFRMTVRESGDGKQWEVHGVLVRGEDKLTPSDPWLVLSGGWLIAGGKISRLQDHGAFPWLSALRRDGTFRVPRERESELLERLWKLPGELAIEWPEAMKLREERFAPRPLLRVMRGKSDHPGPAPLRATLCFLYDEELVEYANPAAAVPEVPLSTWCGRAPSLPWSSRSLPTRCRAPFAASPRGAGRSRRKAKSTVPGNASTFTCHRGSTGSTSKWMRSSAKQWCRSRGS